MGISNLFIVGAGFTKAVFPTAPLNDDFLSQVIGLKSANSPLENVYSKYRLSNIELLLTQLDLDLLAGKSEFTEADRNAISAQLANFVSRFRFKHDVEWL